MIFDINNARFFFFLHQLRSIEFESARAIGVGSLSQYIAFVLVALDCLDELAAEDLGEEVELVFFRLGFLVTRATPADGIPLFGVGCPSKSVQRFHASVRSSHIEQTKERIGSNVTRPSKI